MYKFKNINLDDETMWPKEPRIPLDENFEDDRGYILPLINFPMKYGGSPLEDLHKC